MGGKLNRFESGEVIVSDAAQAAYDVEFDPKTRTLRIRIKVGEDAVQEFDCSKWLYLEETLALGFAEAFALANLSNVPATRTSNHRNVTLGFMRWIRSNFPPNSVGYPEMSVALFDQFDRWLDRRDERGKRVLKMSTSLHLRSVLTGAIGQLLAGPKRELLPSDCRMRRNAFG